MKKISCNLKFFYKWEKLNAHKIIMIFLSKQTKKKKIKKTIREVSFEMKGTSDG